MRYVRLVAVSDEYGTDIGLMLKGTRMFEGFMADRGGEMIAHDLLEHQNGIANIGGVEDELEALGGVWQVRGRWGDFCRDTPSRATPVEHMVSDLTNMWRYIEMFDWRPRVGRYRTQRHDYDEDFFEMIEGARHSIKQDDYDWADNFFLFEGYLDNALHLMRRGFRKAERRFGSRFKGIEQFKAIQRTVANLHKYAVEWEGQEFLLAYGDGEARWSEIREHDYE